MTLDCQFIKIDHSEAFESYAREKLEKIRKFHTQDVIVQLTVSKQGHNKLVSIKIVAANVVFKAEAKSDDYYESLDLAVERALGQVKKRRAKLKNHKNYEVAQLVAEPDTQEEADLDLESWRKAA